MNLARVGDNNDIRPDSHLPRAFVKRGCGSLNTYHCINKDQNTAFKYDALHAIEPNEQGRLSCLIRGQSGQLVIRIQAGSHIKINNQKISIPHDLPIPRIGNDESKKALLIVNYNFEKAGDQQSKSTLNTHCSLVIDRKVYTFISMKEGKLRSDSQPYGSFFNQPINAKNSTESINLESYIKDQIAHNKLSASAVVAQTVDSLPSRPIDKRSFKMKNSEKNDLPITEVSDKTSNLKKIIPLNVQKKGISLEEKEKSDRPEPITGATSKVVPIHTKQSNTEMTQPITSSSTSNSSDKSRRVDLKIDDHDSLESSSSSESDMLAGSLVQKGRRQQIQLRAKMAFQHKCRQHQCGRRAVRLGAQVKEVNAIARSAIDHISSAFKKRKELKIDEYTREGLVKIAKQYVIPVAGIILGVAIISVFTGGLSGIPIALGLFGLAVVNLHRWVNRKGYEKNLAAEAREYVKQFTPQEYDYHQFINIENKEIIKIAHHLEKEMENHLLDDHLYERLYKTVLDSSKFNAESEGFYNELERLYIREANTKAQEFANLLVDKDKNNQQIVTYLNENLDALPVNFKKEKHTGQWIVENQQAIQDDIERRVWLHFIMKHAKGIELSNASNVKTTASLEGNGGKKSVLRDCFNNKDIGKMRVKIDKYLLDDPTVIEAPFLSRIINPISKHLGWKEEKREVVSDPILSRMKELNLTNLFNIKDNGDGDLELEFDFTGNQEGAKILFSQLMEGHRKGAYGHLYTEHPLVKFYKAEGGLMEGMKGTSGENGNKLQKESSGGLVGYCETF